MKKATCLLLAAALTAALLCGCAAPAADPVYSAGYALQVLTPPAYDSCYIAGYHNGWHPDSQLDELTVSALWLDDGQNAVLLLAVDCVGLDSALVGEIRRELRGFCRKTGCDSVNVVSSHTHAGVDTLGLWGPAGISGKNEAFNRQLITAAVQAAKDAWADRSAGRLLYSATPTQGMLQDSRQPVVYDENLYQLRFEPETDSQNGIRLLVYGAHAEALRGGNTFLSADYPGVLRRVIKQETGDDVLFLPGAVGGLIMTQQLDSSTIYSMELTGQRLAACALAPAAETVLAPALQTVRQTFTTDLDNTMFMFYRFLGILGHKPIRTLTGYQLQSEVNLLALGDVTLALVPGEIFPELVTGTGNAADPAPLAQLAARYGRGSLVVAGLANDELGYIIPPSDFVLHPTAPYVLEAYDHYEETNSVGPGCAADLAAAFEKALQKLTD